MFVVVFCVLLLPLMHSDSGVLYYMSVETFATVNLHDLCIVSVCEDCYKVLGPCFNMISSVCFWSVLELQYLKVTGIYVMFPQSLRN